MNRCRQQARRLLRRLRPRTLRSRLLLALAVSGMMPLVFMGVISHTVIGSTVKEQGFEKYSALTRQAAQQTASRMEEAEQTLSLISENNLLAQPRLQEADGAARQRRLWHEELIRIKDTTRRFSELMLYGTDGFFRASASGRTQDEERTAWFQRAAGGHACVTHPERMLGGQGLYVTVYVPVREVPGQDRSAGLEPSPVEPRAVVSGQVSFEPVRQLLNAVRPDPGGFLILLDPHGTVLSSPDEAEVLQKWDETRNAAWWHENRQGFIRLPWRGSYAYVVEELTAAETRTGQPWQLIAFAPAHQMSAVVVQNTRHLMLVGAGTLATILFAGVWLARRLGHPVVEAAAAAQRLAAHEPKVRVRCTGGMREMEHLARAFNRMAGEVELHRERLEQMVEERTRSHKEAEEHAEYLFAELRAALEATEEAVLFIGPEDRILAVNRRFGEFFECDTSSMSSDGFAAWQDYFFNRFHAASGFRDHWKTVMAGDRNDEGEWILPGARPLTLASYSARVTGPRGENMGRLWMFRDLTKQRELQESLEQSQKMDAIGRLAGGVAHDFNNLLTGILGNLRLAEAQLASGPSAGLTSQPREHLSHAAGAAERAAHLVRGLLGFSRRTPLELSATSLNDVIKDFLPLVRRTIDPRTEITFEPAPGLRGIKCDATKLEQVLMNLCVNARDAIDGSGRITISTSNVTLDARHAQRAGQAPGDYVRMSVRDTGCGIAPGHIDKVFEPFFTTKEQGKGTGLGLAICFGITQQHDGWMEAESEYGHGAVFHVYLPAESAAAAAHGHAPAAPRPAPAGGSETILLVDDELVVRTVAETILKQAGYTVLTASDGAEGVEKFHRHRDTISLVLLDMTMPRLSGAEVFRLIHGVDATLPVLICSGYLLDFDDFESTCGGRPAGFIQKPYDLRVMLDAVRSALDAQPKVELLAA